MSLFILPFHSKGLFRRLVREHMAKNVELVTSLSVIQVYKQLVLNHSMSHLFGLTSHWLSLACLGDRESAR